MSYYTPLLGSIPLTLDEIAFIQNLASEAGNDSSVVTLVETGSAAPAAAPSSIGDIFVDTTNDNVYISIGTADAADWVQVNGGGGGGESNTAANLGAGEGVYASKSGVQLRFKSLVGGTDVTLSSDGNEITISADSQTDENYTSTEKTKLSGIEAGADVTDATNVAAAGAVMNTGNETVGGIKTFTSSPVVPTPTTDMQAATKKYVDDNAGGISDGDKGDITVSASGATWTIDNDAVTSAKIANEAVTNAKLSLMTGNTVKVRNAAGTGTPTDLTIGSHSVLGRSAADVVSLAAGNDGVLRRSGSGNLEFGALVTANLGDDIVTNAKLANMATSTIKGRVTGSTGDPEDLTATQVRTLLNVADGATANAGTVTSVAVSGSDGIEVDSGSPVTSSGTIALGVNKSSMLSHLNVEDGADVTDAGNVGSSIHGATGKTTPVGADTVAMIDSEASNVLKKITFTNIAAFLASLTQTLTNKRITKRITTETSSATPTINTDNCDVHRITALTTNITSMTTNLSGTPTTWQLLAVEIIGTATRTVSWGASFANGANVNLPTTTDGTVPLKVLLQWNGSAWACLAVDGTA
jgi:hypothetical protein